MSDNKAKHRDDALKILSGGLGEGMNEYNFKSKVDAAIMATSYLVNSINSIYEPKLNQEGEE
ncbi:hypothetical protein VP191E371_P0009 [Vibrio phage 191E37-1]|nr:hypothetical protein VP191E371_P0009 [Vibrio phage 191E37-1]